MAWYLPENGNAWTKCLPHHFKGVSRGLWSLFLDLSARSAIFWHLKTGTFAREANSGVEEDEGFLGRANWEHPARRARSCHHYWGHSRFSVLHRRCVHVWSVSELALGSLPTTVLKYPPEKKSTRLLCTETANGLSCSIKRTLEQDSSFERWRTHGVRSGANLAFSEMWRATVTVTLGHMSMWLGVKSAPSLAAAKEQDLQLIWPHLPTFPKRRSSLDRPPSWLLLLYLHRGYWPHLSQLESRLVSARQLVNARWDVDPVANAGEDCQVSNAAHPLGEEDKESTVQEGEDYAYKLNWQLKVPPIIYDAIAMQNIFPVTKEFLLYTSNCIFYVLHLV